jgi:hypothetical protein
VRKAKRVIDGISQVEKKKGEKESKEICSSDFFRDLVSLQEEKQNKLKQEN